MGKDGENHGKTMGKYDQKPLYEWISTDVSIWESN